LPEQRGDLRAQRGAATDNVSAAWNRKRGIARCETKLYVITVPLLAAGVQDAA
jgi:hypothetical protein